MPVKFRNRAEGGRLLSQKLSAYLNEPNAIVLGLPRGGVPVAYQVANALNLPLDVFTVRKLGVPGHSELAMGAIASGSIQVLNQSVINAVGVTAQDIERVSRNERRILEQRERIFRGDSPPLDVREKTVLVVDDGLATGASMRAAVTALRHGHPKSIVIAVPVASEETCRELAREVDHVVCVETPDPFIAVGMWYRDFSQTTDEEVRELLARAARERLIAHGPTVS
jgi:putative phosphoribosyl transferase